MSLTSTSCTHMWCRHGIYATTYTQALSACCPYLYIISAPTHLPCKGVAKHLFVKKYYEEQLDESVNGEKSVQTNPDNLTVAGLFGNILAYDKYKYEDSP